MVPETHSGCRSRGPAALFRKIAAHWSCFTDSERTRTSLAPCEVWLLLRTLCDRHDARNLLAGLLMSV